MNEVMSRYTLAAYMNRHKSRYECFMAELNATGSANNDLRQQQTLCILCAQ